MAPDEITMKVTRISHRCFQSINFHILMQIISVVAKASSLDRVVASP